jgi:hypothetical protein
MTAVGRTNSIGIGLRIGITVLAACLIANVIVLVERGTHAKPAQARVVQRTVAGRPQRLHSGDEVVAIFIGASTCPASMRPEMRNAIAHLRSELAVEANQAGVNFYITGAALDWNVDTGIAFLKRLGPFDEVTAGRNWLNMASVRYIIRDMQGAATTPQLLVVRRTTVAQSTLRVSSEQLIARKVGAEAIESWAREGGRGQGGRLDLAPYHPAPPQAR